MPDAVVHNLVQSCIGSQKLDDLLLLVQCGCVSASKYRGVLELAVAKHNLVRYKPNAPQHQSQCAKPQLIGGTDLTIGRH
jgi:hypothetical protein